MSYNPFTLEGKTILITGASSGIGKITAIECSRMGANVIITGRNEKRLQETFEQLEGEGHSQIVADLSISEDIEKLINSIPNLDGLVNNAGINKLLPIKFITEIDINKILKINTIVPIFFTQQIIKKRKINRGGSIVFTSSIGGVYTVSPGGSMYGISKNAIDAFMKFAALEFATTKIRCNSVNPAMVETNMINDPAYTNEDKDRDLARYPLKRYGKPQEVAWGIIYLLSDASAWTTGTTLLLDGGCMLQ